MTQFNLSNKIAKASEKILKKANQKSRAKKIEIVKQISKENKLDPIFMQSMLFPQLDKVNNYTRM